ncbi:MAG TPA: amino acid adenylation domain-containing protein [Candidatus Tectomicrobia bacterium]
MLIHEFLHQSALSRPDDLAVEDGESRRITFRELADLSDLLRDRLHHAGVRRGDRVGLYLPKSIDAVAAIFGVLKSGAAYVPVDTDAPVARNAYILSDCAVKIVVAERRFEGALRAEIARNGSSMDFLFMEATGGGLPLRRTLDGLQATDPAPVSQSAEVSLDDLAYVLYTSGSTGKPKGVMLSHRNALSFVNWCSEVFEPADDERFASHAPFHFDLSILDLYLPVMHGAALVLIAADAAKDPIGLAALISERRITSWYSAPSALSMLAQYGRLQEHDCSALRRVLFAGEVFPVKHLRTLKILLPGPRYFNLYGPTETNVCTFYEIPDHIPDERTQPYPIGKVCSHCQAIVVNEQGQAVSGGQEGELCIGGPGVMQGYWNLPERTANAFLKDASGQGWYKTGDIVVEDSDGDYIFVGRRDRMVKKRGYRVELGEIEAGLYRHPSVKEAAVIALSDDDNGVRVKAFISCREAEQRPTIIELKRFCAENLPIYMVPDLFVFEAALPKTSTDKIDYQKLKEPRE